MCRCPPRDPCPKLLGPRSRASIDQLPEKKEVDRQAALVAKRRTLDRKRQPPDMPDLQGCRVFMADDAKAVLNNTPSHLALALQRAKLVVVEDRAIASLFCVLSPSDPGDRVRAVATQTGAVICTPEMLRTGSGMRTSSLCRQAAAGHGTWKLMG